MSTPTARIAADPAASGPPAAPTPRRPAAPSHRRRVAIALGLALAAGGAYWRHQAGTPETAGRYVTAPVDRGAIEQTVAATGTVNPVKTVQVGTYVSGPIIALDVDFNSPVAQGQRVAKIDPASFVVKVRQAEANLSNARARVEKDRADLALKRLQLERSQSLLAQRLIAQSEIDAARSSYDQAVAQLALDGAGVEQAEAGLDEARVNLGYTDILSPVDGVVVSRNVDVGQTVAASFQTPTLFLIAEDLTKMQVNTSVSESDVGRVREAQTVTFTVDAYPGQVFQGTVVQVRNAPVTVQNVVTYDVVVAVDNAGLELKPGMTANVAIETARRAGVLRLPLRALRFRPDAGKAAGTGSRNDTKGTVYLVDGGTLRAVDVDLGVRDGQHVEVLGGDLEEGDAVVIAARREAAAGTPQKPPAFAGAGRRF